MKNESAPLQVTQKALSKEQQVGDGCAAVGADVDPTVFVAPEGTDGVYPVVIVASSAGGIEALSEFFAELPADLTAAIVIVQHLSAHFPSTLDDILTRRGSCPIGFIKEGEPLRPGRGYLVPSQKFAVLNAGKLHLEPLVAQARGTAPLPANAVMTNFAETLAGERLIAVVLSGTGEDGRAGASAVQKAGGQVLVQQPSSCSLSGMPQSVIDAKIPCDVLSLSAIAKAVAEKARGSGRVSRPKSPSGAMEQPFCSGILWDRFSQVFEQAFGVVPAEFVTKRVMNVIGARMSALNLSRFDDYVEQFESLPAESAAYGRQLVRLAAGSCPLQQLVAFAEAHVWPQLLRRERDPESLRIWVVSSLNGLDGVALAISLQLYLKKHLPSVTFRLFCTALNGQASPLSSRGEMLETDWKQFPDHLQSELLSSPGGEKIVDPALASRVVFASHNSLVDPPFSQVAALFAVGLFEPLQPRMRLRVLSRLGFATRLNGFIILSAEELAEPLESFDVAAGEGSLRALRANSMRSFDEEALLLSGRPARRRGFGLTGVRSLPAEGGTESAQVSLNFRAALFEEVASRLVPASLVITEDLRIVSHFGDFKDILNVTALVPGAQVHALFRAQHVGEIEAGVQSCLVNDVAECLTLRLYNAASVVLMMDVVVRKLTVRLERSLLFSVTFTPRHHVEASQVESWSHDTLKEQFMRELSAHRTLQNELEQTRASLKHSLSQLEAVNEELQAANEELLAGTEELQSTNEELESVNEELYCVNSESQMRIKEMGRQLDASASALYAQDILVLTLDDALNIVWIFGPVFSFVGLQQQDVGRSIATLSFFNDYGVHRLAQMALRSRIEQRQMVTLSSGDPCIVAAVPVEPTGVIQRKDAETSKPGVVLSVYLPRFVPGRIEGAARGTYEPDARDRARGRAEAEAPAAANEQSASQV